jgi:histidine triad (HIT) family protein
MNDASNAYTGDDFYCDEVLNERTAVNVVAETQHVLAFHHTRPYWSTHIVVIPKQHVRSLLEIEEPLLLELMVIIQQVARAVTDKHGACFVLTNIGDYQHSKHLHWHVAFGEPIR